MRTAALVGFSGSVVSGWSMLADRLTTASTAAVISRAYGPAALARCCALMIREDAMSSWALVILAVDLTVAIRRLTARSWAPIWLLLLRCRHVPDDGLGDDLGFLDGRDGLVGDKQLPGTC